MDIDTSKPIHVVNCQIGMVEKATFLYRKAGYTQIAEERDGTVRRITMMRAAAKNTPLLDLNRARWESDKNIGGL